jgi:hypothetical protein
MSTKVIKLTVLVIDFDGLGADGVKEVIETTSYPNHCISPTVKSIEVREVEWSSDHPLNIRNLADAEYKRLFAE